MEHKTNEAFITEIEQEQGIIKAIFAVMGNVDFGNDRIHNGAFAKTFQERGHKILVLDQHRTDSINRAIAKTLHLRELERQDLPLELLSKHPEATGGAEIQAQFSLEDDESKKAFFRLRNGWVSEWSFGYDALDTSFTRENQNGKQVSVREIRTIKLYEVSPVLFGMNDLTMTTDAKMSAERQIERIKNAFEFWQKDNLVFDRLENHDLIATKDGIEFTVLYNDKGNEIEFEILGGESMDITKGASGKLDLPLASREMAWDNDKAIASIRSVTDSTDAPSASYKNGFFWYDAENEDKFTAYKLPFAQEVDGSLKAIPRGIFAVAGVLRGSRGGIDIPEANIEAVKARVARYYAKMKDEFDDDSIVVPWAKEAQEEQDKESTKQSDTEQKSGRAISARNEERIRTALTNLQTAITELNGLFPVETEPEQTIEDMELDSSLNTTTIAKSQNVFTFNVSVYDNADIENFANMIKAMLKLSEHDNEAGPDETEIDNPVETPTVKESPFDVENALRELKNLEIEFMEVNDNE